jgi:peptidoglycan/xylan/chitin deacetylase (PgdA/CDA1 family)
MIVAAVVLGILALVYCSGFARWGLAILVFCGAATAAALGFMFPRWQMFGQSLCRISTDYKAVALTFNDGPSPQNTPALLELLAANKAHATFFCIGDRVNLHHELVQRIAREGHEVENHTFQHSTFTQFYSEQRLRNDLSRAQTAIERATGKPPRFFRPPMGFTNRRLFRVTKELGLTVAGCSIRALDRRSKSPEKIVRRIMEQVRPGAIILMHDRGLSTNQLLAVVSLLLEQLRHEGYQCARLDELTDKTP